MKYLSINTDDFGLSVSINQGILAAFKHGILTDASLMANGPAFREAATLARNHHIPVSAHINLVRGPMLRGVSFSSSVPLLWRMASNRRHLNEMELEARTQIERILQSGLKIQQINSEKHSHFYPSLFALWLRLAEDYGIPNIRYIREFNVLPTVQGLKANLLSLFSLRNRQLLRASSIKTCQHFRGILYTGVLNQKRLLHIVSSLKPGWTELMVHVGLSGPIDDIMGSYFLNRQREVELRALLNSRTKSIMRNHNIILRSFGGLHAE